MSDEHSTYEEIASKRRGTAECREGYAEARRAFLIGQAGPAKGITAACPRAESNCRHPL